MKNIKENTVEKAKLLSILLFVLITLSACKNTLEENPTSFVSPNNFYKSAEDANSALTGAYSQLTQGSFANYIASYKFIRLVEKPTPEVGVGTNTPQYPLDEWTWTPGTTERNVLPSFYGDAYKGINAANEVINNVPAIDMDPELRARYVAEARFLRAVHYYYLVGLFGGVPIVKSADGKFQKPRAPEDSVYTFIINDLKKAIKDLPPASEYDANNAERASKGAAQTLLAKFYLQRGSLNASNGITGERQISHSDDFQQAADLVQQVIDSGVYSLPNDVVKQYKDMFIEKISSNRNPEVIFSIVNDPSLGVGGGLPCLAVSSAAGPSLAPNSWNQYTSELPFYTSFSDVDLRKKVTFLTEFKNTEGKEVKYDINDVENDGIPEDSPPFRKYTKAAPGAGCNDDNDWIFLRYPDVLLMKAEALNEVNNGPTAEAYSAINQVRERAGLEPLLGLNYEAFRKAVYTNRRKELVVEGHGWFTVQRFWDIATRRIHEHAEFDAKFPPERRFGPRIDKLDINDPKDRLFPIPASALRRNPKLTQNPGY